MVMPKAPSAASPFTTSSGIVAVRSMRAASTEVCRKWRREPRNRSPFSTASGDGLGAGCTRSRSKSPRKSCLPKLGLPHSVSLACSATSRAFAYSVVMSTSYDRLPPDVMPVSYPRVGRAVPHMGKRCAYVQEVNVHRKVSVRRRTRVRSALPDAGHAEDGLAEGGPDEPLDEAGDGNDGTVVDLDQPGVGVADAAPPYGQPPGDAAQEVDRLEDLDVQPRFGDGLAQRGGRVAGHVADLAVEVPVELHVSRHPDDDAPAGQGDLGE